MSEPDDRTASPKGEAESSPEGTPAQPRNAAQKRDWRALMRKDWRLVAAAALFAAGVTFVILGWYGAAYTNIITEQIPYLISGGLLGLGLIIVAGMLVSGLAHEREMRAMRDHIARALAGSAPHHAPDQRVPANSNGYHVFVVPGGRSYHEPGCPILEGKTGVKELVPAQAAGSGYAPCKLCTTHD